MTCVPDEPPTDQIPIPERPTCGTVEYTDQIHHFKINIRRSYRRHELRFSLKYKHGKPVKGRDIREYAMEIADDHRDGYHGNHKSLLKNVGYALAFVFIKLFNVLRAALEEIFDGETPYDVEKLDGPKCWILLELDPDMNWGFAHRSYGVSMKSASDGAGDYGLHEVFKGEIPKPVCRITPTNQGGRPKACRVVYWAVPKRNPKRPKGMNFHVEFYQRKPKTGDIRRLPTVFDPNVPNDGGAGIPGGPGMSGRA